MDDREYLTAPEVVFHVVCALGLVLAALLLPGAPW
jgi:hypothetical protein